MKPIKLIESGLFFLSVFKQGLTGRNSVIKTRIYHGPFFLVQLLFIFLLSNPNVLLSQISRGASEGEIYVQCPMYNDALGYIYHGLFRSTDDGEHLSLNHTFDKLQLVRVCLADTYPGVVYNVRDSAFDKSTDYGITWNAFDKPEGTYAASGDMPGELYIAGSKITSGV